MGKKRPIHGNVKIFCSYGHNFFGNLAGTTSHLMTWAQSKVLKQEVECRIPREIPNSFIEDGETR